MRACAQTLENERVNISTASLLAAPPPAEALDPWNAAVATPSDDEPDAEAATAKGVPTKKAKSTLPPWRASSSGSNSSMPLQTTPKISDAAARGPMQPPTRPEAKHWHMQGLSAQPVPPTYPPTAAQLAKPAVVAPSQAPKLAAVPPARAPEAAKPSMAHAAKPVVVPPRVVKPVVVPPIVGKPSSALPPPPACPYKAIGVPPPPPAKFHHGVRPPPPAKDEAVAKAPHGPRGLGENSAYHTAWHRAKKRGPEALALFHSVWPRPPKAKRS